MTKVTVVIGTLDLYKDVWGPFCHGLKKFWPSHWPIKAITNQLDFPCGKAIKAGGDHTNWGRRMRCGLAQVKTPIILWLTGDNWLTGPVDTEALEDFVGHMLVKGIHHIRLYPGWDHDRSKGPFKYDQRLLVFERKSPYRASLKPGLWNGQTFSELLKDGESPWDFENLASKRSRRYGDGFMATRGWHLFFVTNGCPDGEDWPKSPVVQGRWSVSAKRYCEREGLKVDFSQHPVRADPFGKDRPSYILP